MPIFAVERFVGAVGAVDHADLDDEVRLAHFMDKPQALGFCCKISTQPKDIGL
jgi:hypothetical protein